MTERAAWAQVDASGSQVVDVTIDGGYHPARIIARAGLPLRLVFRRLEDDSCSARVVFSSPRLDRRLGARQPTAIDLPAQPAGHVRFTCGMGRYRGRIDLVDDDMTTASGRLRALTSGGVGARLIVAILVALSIVAIAALLLLTGLV